MAMAALVTVDLADQVAVAQAQTSKAEAEDRAAMAPMGWAAEAVAVTVQCRQTPRLMVATVARAQ
jgi:hypothetical protein